MPRLSRSASAAGLGALDPSESLRNLCASEACFLGFRV